MRLKLQNMYEEEAEAGEGRDDDDDTDSDEERTYRSPPSRVETARKLQGRDLDWDNSTLVL